VLSGEATKANFSLWFDPQSTALGARNINHDTTDAVLKFILKE
jgi:hypothetical protein